MPGFQKIPLAIPSPTIHILIYSVLIGGFYSKLPPFLEAWSPDDILLLVLKSVQQLELPRDWNLSLLSWYVICLNLLSSIFFGQVGGVTIWFGDVLDDFFNLTLKPLSSLISISGLKDLLRWISWWSNIVAILTLNAQYCVGFSKTSLWWEIERCLLLLLVKDDNQLLCKGKN